MAKEFIDFDSNLISHLEVLRNQFVESKNYFGALCLIQLLLEVDLKFTIGILLPPDERFDAKGKYWNSNESSIYLSQLTDYYELLDGNSTLIKNLREFNTLRNNIIHNAIKKFNSPQALERELEKVVNIGQNLHNIFYTNLPILSNPQNRDDLLVSILTNRYKKGSNIVP
ncbi:MAG: hypothetical protein QG640_355 [Patescibacteria group bacterium]|nr:hypothetical protein [Patescibacteria group bacterium]